MFDLAAKDGSVRKREYESPIPPGSDGEGEEAQVHPLDTTESVELHRRLNDYYLTEVDIQSDNRVEMAIDADFNDNIQWTEADSRVLEERGQLPVTYNVVSAMVNWLLGTEKRARSDFNILPRRKEQGAPAERKTALLKYLSDVNKTKFHISRAFADAVKVGIGWIEEGVQDGDFEEPIYSRYESWRNILWDSAATEMDLSDGRYMFRAKWVDEDIAKALFADRQSVVGLSVTDAPYYGAWNDDGDEVMDQPEIERTENHLRSSSALNGFSRRRVKLIEAWYRQPASTEIISGGMFRGEIFDPASPGHVDAIDRKESVLVAKVMMRMNVAIFCSNGLLYNGPSPYRHNKFPFTPVWGNRRDRDGMPYGIIRGVRSIQMDINKRATKALHVFSTNKVIMDEGAVEDLDEFREEISRPDAIIIKKQGKELDINADRDIGQWNLEIMSRNIQMVQQVGGVTDENMGRRTNAVSGRAIEARQDQGSLATGHYFDNLRLLHQVRGEKQLANAEQYVSEEKTFRITGQRSKPEWVTVNDGLPDNDIVRTKADYIISEADWNATIRAAAAEQLLETISRFPPEVGMALLDLVVENMDLPNRDEIVKRIRSINGQRDPDAEQPTEEEVQRQQASAEEQKFAMATAIAQLKALEANAEKTMAQAAEIKAKIVGANVTAQRNALQAAQDAAAVPSAAPIADMILHESGFTSRTDLETEANKIAAAQQQAQSQQNLAGMPQQPPEGAGDQQIGLGRQAGISP